MSGLNIMIVGLWVTFTLNIMMVALRLSSHGAGRIFDRLKIRAFRISVNLRSDAWLVPCGQNENIDRFRVRSNKIYSQSSGVV